MTADTSTPSPPWLDRAAYPFTPHSVALRAGTVHYVDEGAGPPILFVHGTPTWSFEYRHLIRGLSNHHRCVAPDHLGFGLSSRPASFAYTPEAHAAVLAEFVDTLDLRDITLVVHDYGGPIGLPLALQTPSRVSQVVLLNTWAWSFDDNPVMLRRGRLAGGSVGAWLYRHVNFSLKVIMPSAYGDRTRLTPAIHRQYLEVFRDKDARVRVLHALARALLQSSAFYQSLWQRMEHLRRKRVLIVWGLRDSAFRPDQLERWIAALPDAAVVRLEQAGHWPHEEEPQAVLDAIVRWMG
jgi:haloalkane dehalogenase